METEYPERCLQNDTTHQEVFITRQLKKNSNQNAPIRYQRDIELAHLQFSNHGASHELGPTEKGEMWWY